MVLFYNQKKSFNILAVEFIYAGVYAFMSCELRLYVSIYINYYCVETTHVKIVHPCFERRASFCTDFMYRFDLLAT